MLAALAPRFNIAPSTQVPIVVQSRATGEIRPVLARWGFIPHWWREAKPPGNSFNARSEDAPRKPMWRDAWLLHRCLIAATHWYEWRSEAGVKLPFALQTTDGRGFMFAGLYSEGVSAEGELLYTAAILTREAAPSVAHVHDRMPVILHPNAWRMWLDPRAASPEAVKEILIEHAVGEARSWRISTLVNAARNETPDILMPVPDDDGGEGR